MAKKNNSELSFKEMRTMMEGISKKTSIVIETEKKEFSYINTGIYMLNALLSKSILNGGISKNRFTVFAGEESVGKSYLCYNIARNAQKEGYSVIYIDTEFSIELAELEDFGIDISEDNFMLIRSNKVEDLKMMISQFLDKLKEQKLKGLDISKTIIFLDSIGQLASIKETEDAIEGKNKVDMSRAKAIKSLFRIITADLGFLEIPLVATNHIYMSQDLFPKAIQSGGKGVDYSASTIVYLTKAKLKTGQEDELDLGASGIIVTAIARKNRKAKPKKIKFEINHTSGTNRFKGLEYFCTPENFDKIGIAKVKEVVDKKTGEVTYTTGGTKWFVKHLNKSFYEAQLYNETVFTKEVLEKLEPIIADYFSYSNQDEIDKIALEMDALYQPHEGDDDFDIDSDDDGNLFN
jgi:RecA/RadA recombinase